MAIPTFHGIFSSLKDTSLQETPASNEVLEQSASVSINEKPHIPLDIYEEKGCYIIEAPIAGVQLDDIDIEVDGRELTIRATRQRTSTIPDDQYYLRECFQGECVRKVTLPVVVDHKSVKAMLKKDNVLKVLIPKKAETIKIVRVNE